MTANLFLLLSCLLPMYLACVRDDGRGRPGALFCAFVVLIPLGVAPLARIANIRFEGLSQGVYYSLVLFAGANILYLARSVAKRPRSALRVLLHLTLGALFVILTVDASFSAPEAGPTPHLSDRLELVTSWVSLLLATGELACALCWQTVTRFTPSKGFMAACSVAIWIGAALTGLDT